MRTSKPTTCDQPSSLTVAESLAPEDLRIGDYVATLHVIWEYPSCLAPVDTMGEPKEALIRLRLLPKCTGIPLKVKAACLPFVLVKRPFGDCRTLDVRKLRLAKLDHTYAKKVRKSLKNARQTYWSA